jgi:hypothetical protein
MTSTPVVRGFSLPEGLSGPLFSVSSVMLRAV